MRCANCAWDNQEGLAFCTNCGARLIGASAAGGGASARGAHEPTPPAGVVRAEELGLSETVLSPSTVPAGDGAASGDCAACGTSNDPTTNYCRRCGAALRGDRQAPQSDAPPARRPSGRGHDGQTVNRPGEERTHLRARLVTLLKDGSEGRAIELEGDSMDLGSSEGDVVFPDDTYLSPRHARIERTASGFLLTDLDSVNGIYMRIREAVELQGGDTILVGQQVLRFERLAGPERSFGACRQRGVLVFGTPDADRHGRLVRYTAEGVGRDVYYLFRDETVLGRENGDIVFTDDPFLSRKHAALRVDSAGRMVLEDLGSANGTALRVRARTALRAGDQLRMGRHLFRFETASREAPRR